MEPESIRIACVIPAFNREDTVGRAIESALAQTHAPAEILVVDDGSTDRTRERVEAFGDRVRYIRQENAGAAVARNRGVHATNAEWVAFLDSDDFWLAGHLAALAEAIARTDGAADFYFANLRRPEEEGGVTHWQLTDFEIDGEYELVLDATPWVVRPRIPMMLQGTVFHRERFLAQGGLWEKLRRRHDTHVFLKLGIGGSACAVASVGTQMTSDASAGRLTSVMDPTSRRFFEYSVMCWGDILRRFPDLGRDARGRLRHRLLVSHMRLARLHLDARHPLRCLVHLARAFRCAPLMFVRSVFGGRPTEAELFATANR